MRLCYLLLALTSVTFTCLGQSVSDWAKVVELEKQREEKVPAGQNAVEFYAGRKHVLHDACANFLEKYPGDSNAGTALLWKIDNTDFSGSPDERTALLTKISQETEALFSAHPQPADTESKVREALLYCYLDNDDLVQTPQQAADLAAKIEQFLAGNPKTENRVKLEIAQASLLLKSDREKGMAFLEKLSQDPDPELVPAAKAALTKAKLVGNKLDLQFVDTKGQPVDLSQFLGKVVLIDFWASWCPDCVREMPQVQKIYQDYAGKGLAIIGISLDKDQGAMANYIAKRLIPWPQYFDGKGWRNEIAARYGVHEIPEMWLVNKQGIVETTSADVTQLAATVQRLVAK